MNRREFLQAAGGVTGAAALAGSRAARAADASTPAPSSLPAPSTSPAEKKKALISITLDLEMSRNFPHWEDTHWDYEKGNLNDDTKRYAVEACRRIKAAGGVAHLFVVGRVMEQEDLGWLKGIVEAGHTLGNHTYDHIFVKAQTLGDLQARFRRCPWLVDGRNTQDVIRESIRMTGEAVKTRIGVDLSGFRTPGGFSNGLDDSPQVRKMLLELGFRWVSGKYPTHPYGDPGKEPTADVIAGIVAAQQPAQPFVYPEGLIELPMSPISDVGAFRAGRWKVEGFMAAVRAGVKWAIANGGVYDFLCHPSCIGAVDTEFKTIDMICELVKKAGPDRAALVDLDAVAARVKPPA